MSYFIGSFFAGGWVFGISSLTAYWLFLRWRKMRQERVVVRPEGIGLVYSQCTVYSKCNSTASNALCREGGRPPPEWPSWKVRKDFTIWLSFGYQDEFLIGGGHVAENPTNLNDSEQRIISGHIWLKSGVAWLISLKDTHLSPHTIHPAPGRDCQGQSQVLGLRVSFSISHTAGSRQLILEQNWKSEAESKRTEWQ